MTGAFPPALSVYLHLPWCLRKCPYCDFNSHTAGAPAERDAYVDALAADIAGHAAAVEGRTASSVFIGGGTPSLFSPAQIDRLLTTLRACVAVADDAEITLEANPGAVERGSLAGYRDAGVNRLSLGAQSFDDRHLARLGRIHGAEDIVAAFDEARSAGFDNVNLDIMFALPGQSSSQAADDLGRALALAPEHISCYQLTLEPNTVFHARPPADLPGEDAAADMQEAAVRQLRRAGYRRYEVSAYCRPGFECRHNLNYWRYGDYLGLGAGAHGKLTDAGGAIWRTTRPANPRRYMESMAAGPAAGSRRRVADADAAFEFMLNVLRLPSGFAAADFEARTGLPVARLEPALADSCRRGLMERVADRTWRPTARGYRYLNDLQSLFLPAGGE